MMAEEEPSSHLWRPGDCLRPRERRKFAVAEASDDWPWIQLTNPSGNLAFVRKIRSKHRLGTTVEGQR